MIAIGRALYPMDSNHGELDRVTQNGRISRVIDISASQEHVVPTALVHHGATYIANLGVFDPGDRAGDEHVWRLTGHRTLKVRATGVEKVLGLAFRGGKLYALEMSTAAGSPTPGTGAIVRVRAHGPAQTIVSGMTFPTGMTVGSDGVFYVSNQGFGAGARPDPAHPTLTAMTTPGPASAPARGLSALKPGRGAEGVRPRF